MEFLRALQTFDRGRRNLVIPDIKCFSPKEGDLMRGRDPVAYAKALAAAGAPVLSVVTEEKEFHGSVEMLRAICRAVDVPVLRKDFLETREDLVETANAGARAVLLMYSTLGKERLHALYADALALGLTPFVETHTPQELAWAGELKPGLVGINNRDILKLERDDGTVAHTRSLAGQAPAGSFVISESSIQNGSQVRAALAGGADGMLVGTAILQAADPVEMYRSLSAKAGVKICGLMDLEGVDLCGRCAIDQLGFVVEYPVAVPWNLSAERAAPLINRSKAYGETVVVTGGSAEKVLAQADRLKPDWVQLHYKETFEESDRIAGLLKGRGVQVIRSVPTGEEARREMFGTADLLEITEMLNRSQIDAVLFDSRDGDNASRGGDGVEHAFGGGLRAAIKKSQKPVLLGGGITGENAGEIIRAFTPGFVDVMSGVEDTPGKKSEEKLRALLDAVRRF